MLFDRPNNADDENNLLGLISTGRKQFVLGEKVLASDTRRNFRDFRSGVKLTALVVLVSVAMGVAAWAFLLSLDIATDFREGHMWIFALLPLVGVGTAWVYRNHGLAARRGNNLVIDSALSDRLIHLRMAALTFICSALTHLTGGSAGREGAAVQIGGTIASNVSHLAKLGSRAHHDLMLAGISAAFGSIFGSPLAGAFFGMEMCFVGKIDYTAGIYCLVASCTGYSTSLALGTVYEAHRIASIPALGPKTIIVAVLAGVAFGFASRVFSALIRGVKMLYARLFTNYLVSALAGSLIVLAAYALLGAWHYAGLSTWLVGAGFSGKTTLADALLKLVVTALTLGAGFQGGEVTPLFGIGAALGGWFGVISGFDPSFLAALGMLGVFCGGLNVPITTIMMSIDLFRGRGAIYFVIVAFISYLISGHRGVYPAQRIVTPKRRSLLVDEGATVADAIRRHREIVSELEESIEQGTSASPSAQTPNEPSDRRSGGNEAGQANTSEYADAAENVGAAESANAAESVNADKSEPANPEPTKPEQTNPEQANPEQTKPELTSAENRLDASQD